MKKGISILFAIGVIFMLVACSNSDGERNDGKPSEEFYFEYVYWTNPEQKNVFSSKDGYIQKDLLQDGIVKNEWKISKEDISEIKKIFIDYNVTTIDKKVVASNYSSGNIVLMSPSSEEFYIKFCLDGKEYKIEGDETIYMVSEENQDGVSICNFLDELKEKLFKQQVYLNMPNVEGAYQ